MRTVSPSILPLLYFSLVLYVASFVLPRKVRIGDEEDSLLIHFILKLTQSFTADPKKKRREPVVQYDSATLIFFFPLLARRLSGVNKSPSVYRVAHRVARSFKGAARNVESSSGHDTCNSCFSVSLFYYYSCYWLPRHWASGEKLPFLL